MPKLFESMALLKDVFDKHAGPDKTLNKHELHKLLEAEFGPANQAEQKKFFTALDSDGDGQVNFQEFVTFVAALSVMISEGI